MLRTSAGSVRRAGKVGSEAIEPPDCRTETSSVAIESFEAAPATL